MPQTIYGDKMHTNNHKMELLAPAGGIEQLRAATIFGADAIYLAAQEFGMRARARNFTMNEITKAVKYAHSSSVKVYVTVNTQMMQDDIAKLPAFLEQINDTEADALIVGDVGAFSLAKKYAPRCALHVSTQASVANSEAAKVWHSMGATRIVCAREMTLEDIARMKDEIPPSLELEVFAHGAQCMAVSGRCLISSHLAQRSSNKGDCAQPCRWKYALVEEKRPGMFMEIDEDERGSYLMNAFDLNMLSYLDELKKAGVDSIKIEGRNKKAFYVATVVNVYRAVLDGADAKDIEDELMCISHRPYGTGFFFENPKQASDFDGYEQETLHVADVLSCDIKDSSASSTEVSTESERCEYEIKLRIRNRIYSGETVEVLSPHKPIRHLTISNLKHVGKLDNNVTNNLIENTGIGFVEVANRTSDMYSVTSPFHIEEGSFLRIRQYRRSARHPND